MVTLKRTLRKFCFREVVVYCLVWLMLFGLPIQVARARVNPDPGDLPTYTTQGVDYDIGAGSIGTIVPGVNSLTINSVVNGTAIYINNHDIGSLGTVTYDQASGGWVCVKVNEILGTTPYGDGYPTGIAGNLTFTQNGILLNPKGIVTAPGSYINARNAVLSAMRITDTDFTNFANGTIDNLNFYTQPGDIGSVINDGTIDGSESVYLVATNIGNAGTIVSPGGCVVMAAGESAVIGRPGSDVVVQVTITDPAGHMLNNTGSLGDGSVILAAGDIYSTAISGVQELRAEAKRNITLTGDVDSTGDITLIADADTSGGVDGGDVHAQALTAGGTVDISASDETINLHADVTAGGDILLNNTTQADAGITLNAGDDVVLAGGKTLTGAGALTVEATDDIIFGVDVVATHETTADVGTAGDVSAGTLTLDAGDDIYAHGKLTSTVGNVDIYADGRAYLMDDVTAYSDLILHDRSEVSDGVVLTADHDVRILAMLEALGDLTIVATSGGIDATDVSMNDDNKGLSLTQNNSLHMEDALQHVGNSDDTDLFAQSTAGSVTSSKADTWQSIAAEAATFINLNDSDTGGDITTKALTTTDGDILITSDFGKVHAKGDIRAGGDEGDVKITAKNESSDAIFLEDKYIEIEEEVWDWVPITVEAGRDIWLNNNTWAADGVLLDADQDVRVGWKGLQDPWDPEPGHYEPKTLTGDGALTVKASRDIILGGAVVASDDAVTSAVGDLILMADADTVDGDFDAEAGGDMIAYSTIANPGGDIDIYSSDGTTYLYDNVTAGVDLILHNDTVVATADRQLSAGQDLTLSDDKSLDAVGGLWLEAGRDITLGGPVEASVVSAGNLHLHADTVGSGIMWAKDTVTNDGGTANPGSHICIRGSTIKLDDNVTAGLDILLHNNTITADGVILDAGDDVALKGGQSITGNGNLTVLAGDDIIFGVTDMVSHESTPTAGAAGNVSADGTLILTAGDDIYAHGKLSTDLGSGGNITATADDNINLYNIATSADADGTLTLTADADDDDDIGNLTVAGALYGNMALSGYNVTVDGIIDSAGTLDVDADYDITLNANVKSASDMTMDAGRDILLNWGSGITESGGSMTLNADKDNLLTATAGHVKAKGLLKTTTPADGDMTIESDCTTFLYDGAQSAGEMTIIADKGNNWAPSNYFYGAVDASGPLVTTNPADGDMTVKAAGEIRLSATLVSANAAGNMHLEADTGNNDADMIISGNLLAGGNIDLYSSNNTTYLGGNLVQAAGNVTLHNNTELDGGALQRIAATTGKLDAKGWVHKTSAGNLEMFGGYNIDDWPICSVWAVGDVTVDDGELSIKGNAAVRLDGSIYSSGDMELAANQDGDLNRGNLVHYGETIQSFHGDVDLSAKDGWIDLDGGPDMPAIYVSAGGDILLRDDTWVQNSRKLYAGDDVVLAGGERISANGSLTVEAENDIMFGVNIATHEATDPPAGSSTDPSGDVTVNGDLILTAGDDIYARGKLETLEGSGGNITANADDDIRLYNTPTSARADTGGTLTLIADFDSAGGGNLTVDGDLFGNMYLSGYDVTEYGNITSYGILDVLAVDDIKLKRNVSSVGAMTMNAGDDIELNRSSGNTSSDSTITLTAGDDITIGKSSSSEGNVTANGHMGIFAGDGRYDDVKVYGKLTTLEDSGGNITVTAGDDIRLYGTWSDDITPVYESAEADGTLTLTADTSGNGSGGGGNLKVDGSLVGNMYLSGTDVTVDGDVTSFGTLDVDADDDIRLKSNVISSYAMTMNAGDNIWLNEDGVYTSSGDTMTLNAGLKYDDDPEPDFDSDEMNGSIKISGYATSKSDMTMNATGGGIILFDEGIFGMKNDIMSGSIYIQDYAYSQGQMTMNAVGGGEFETLDFSEIVLMNGSIKIGDYAKSVGNMAMSATGGSEGIDLLLPDLIDFDGMNGSIKIGDYAESTEGGITMTADGGCEFLTNDYVDVDLMDGSIKIGGNIISLLDMELEAHGGSEVLTEDELDVDGLNGSILICGDAEAREGQMKMTAVGGSEILTCDEFDIDGMNGSILIGGSAGSQYDMELLAVGGSEFLTADKVDIDGMNGSILINGARSYGGSVRMTAIGGSDFGTCDLIDFDAMNGSIKINNYVESMLDMDLLAIGGSEFCTFDVFDASLMNGSIFIDGDAKTYAGDMTLKAIGGSDFHTLDIVDADCMNGSIKVLGSLKTYGDIDLTAIGGSEFGSFDFVDIDGMNGSIFVEGCVRARERDEGEGEMVGGDIAMTAIGGSDFDSSDIVDIDGMNGSIKINGFVKADKDIDLTAIGGSEFCTFDALDIDGMNGSIKIAGFIKSGGDMTLKAVGGSDFRTLDLFDADCMNGSIKVCGWAESDGEMKMTAIGGSEFCSADLLDIAGMNGSIDIFGLAKSGGDMTLKAIGGSELGTIDLLDLSGMNGSIKLGGFAHAGRDMKLTAIGGSEFKTLDFVDAECMNGSIKICGYAKADRDMTLTAIGGSEFLTADKFDISGMNGSIKFLGYAESGRDMTLTAIGGSEFCTLDCVDFALMNGSILFGGYAKSGGNMTMTAVGGSDFHTFDGFDGDVMNGSIFLAGSAESGGDMTLRAVGGGEFGSFDYDGFGLLNGDVVATGDLTSTGGSVSIYSDNDTIYLGGDVTAFINVLLNNNTKFIRDGDQHVTAQTGMITANGYLDKRPRYWGCGHWSDGSLYLQADGDISLADYVTAADDCLSGGGVSIISDNGKIYTAADSPDPEAGDYVLNVDITGRSDHYADVGVDLPFGGEDSGKAAIIVMSGKDLKLGPDGELSAYGKYYDDVDDRVGVGFLAVPATIGDALRDEGDAFDAAIYVASKGDVDVSSPVSILSREPVDDLIIENGRYECIPKGAMIVDARDTVTFDAAPGGQFETSLANGDVGNRLEVCSRITEWLYQAVAAGRLPYAGGASAMSTLWYGNPDSYILRGAGLDNPAITDGRAWVLENPPGASPLYAEAGEPAEEQAFGEGGCPALMEWLALEIGIPADVIQVVVENAFAYSTDIQPCEMCARLKDASTVLGDTEGTAIAALGRVVVEFAAPGAPPSEEQMALIASAVATPEAGTHYAAAGQWLDALAEYVGILSTEMGFSVPDSVAFVGKYLVPITEGDNVSLTAYVEARLAALGG